MTNTRRTGPWALLLAIAGIALILAGIAWAIFEGYASDIEMRPAGSIVPAVLVGAVGLVCLVIGVALSIRGPRKPRKSTK